MLAIFIMFLFSDLFLFAIFQYTKRNIIFTVNIVFKCINKDQVTSATTLTTLGCIIIIIQYHDGKRRNRNLLQDSSNNLDGIFLILCLSPTISKEQTEYLFQMVVSNVIIVKFEIYQILYVNGYSLFINCLSVRIRLLPCYEKTTYKIPNSCWNPKLAFNVIYQFFKKFNMLLPSIK